MCLDIDPDSVIHKHLVKKLTNESWGSYTTLKKVEKWRLRSPSSKNEDAYHSLTMLPSFHISLGAPAYQDPKTELITCITDKELHELIGAITLAKIHVSTKNNKKSAWIYLNADKIIFDLISHRTTNYSKVGSLKHSMHISLANLTGNPRDSIARPEDCIIDTITA